MAEWKEVLIGNCVALEIKRNALLNAEERDKELVELRHQSDALGEKITRIANERYCNQVDDIDSKLENIHNQLIEKWDIIDKTYECEAGIATVRTTKSLLIADKKRLISVLLSIDKLPEAIRSWNLSYLRKLKDVDMIEDEIAYYDEHQNVIIKGVGNK